MTIGIIGSGNIGGSLGRLWAAAGHRVLFGSRDPAKLDGLVRQAGPNARSGTPAETADFGEVVLEAIPFGRYGDLPADRLAGKVVLSAANYYPDRDGRIDLSGGSQTELVARHLAGARVVKAFNMMRATVMAALADGGGTPGLAIFLAGDAPAAVATAAGLVRDARFTPVEVGPLADGALFQSDGPLYDRQWTEAEARAALDQARRR